MENITNEIKDFLIEGLEDMRGENREAYPSDLGYYITEAINVDGSVHCNRYRSIETIKNNFEFFGELVNYCKNNFDMILNPFDEPEKAEVIAYIEGVNYLLADLESFQEAEEKSQYDTITLSDSLLNAMISELKENEFEINF